MAIEIEGKTLETDEEGYLVNLKDWVPAVADAMAKEDDLELTDEVAELRDLGGGLLRGRGEFLGVAGVLLRHLVEFGHAGVDLGDARGLLLGGTRDLTEQRVHLLGAGCDLFEDLADSCGDGYAVVCSLP